MKYENYLDYEITQQHHAPEGYTLLDVVPSTDLEHRQENSGQTDQYGSNVYKDSHYYVQKPVFIFGRPKDDVVKDIIAEKDRLESQEWNYKAEINELKKRIEELEKNVTRKDDIIIERERMNKEWIKKYDAERDQKVAMERDIAVLRNKLGEIKFNEYLRKEEATELQNE